MRARALRWSWSVAVFFLASCGGGGGPVTPPDDDDSSGFFDDDDTTSPPDDDDDSTPVGDDDDTTPLLWVNELCSNNAGWILDDLGEPSDWIEIYNPGSTPVVLAGMTVSDDWTLPAQHVLPAGVVVPTEGFLLLWASGGSDPEGVHLPFRLSSGGEAVGLFAVDGVAIDWVEFPALNPDEAWARLPDGASEWSVVSLGTPGSSNVELTIEQAVLVEAASDWAWLDTGVDPPATWTEADFDDSAWSVGPAPLGYGDPVATEVSYGPNSSSKYITTWFRHEFFVAADVVEGAVDLTVSMRVDDGAVVHLNGAELVRAHMPAGALTSSTLASQTASGAAETTFVDYVLPVTALQSGANVLAVEVHQVQPGSSDISFDLSLSAEVWGEGR